jgi:hypothetical protein
MERQLINSDPNRGYIRNIDPNYHQLITELLIKCWIVRYF